MFRFFGVRNEAEGEVGAHENGTDSLAPRSEVMKGRKQWDSVSSPRHRQLGTEPLCVAPVPPRRLAGQSKRAPYQVSKPRKLSAEEEVAIRGRAGNQTLRELAAEFGVSHETVRTVVRRGGLA